jgi:hypothetical protein
MVLRETFMVCSFRAIAYEKTSSAPAPFPWENGSMTLKLFCLLEEAFWSGWFYLGEAYCFRGKKTIGDTPNLFFEMPNSVHPGMAIFADFGVGRKF